jgi:hypothetical protein
MNRSVENRQTVIEGLPRTLDCPLDSLVGEPPVDDAQQSIYILLLYNSFICFEKPRCHATRFSPK